MTRTDTLTRPTVDTTATLAWLTGQHDGWQFTTEPSSNGRETITVWVGAAPNEITQRAATAGQLSSRIDGMLRRRAARQAMADGHAANTTGASTAAATSDPTDA